MKWMQGLRSRLPKHKYAINAKLLGDQADLAWSNLGAWEQGYAYPQACQALAERLAQTLDLKPQDHLLDLGCGLGASVVYWHEHYQVQCITALDLQPACIENIKNVLNSKIKSSPTAVHFSVDAHCGSFLNLKQQFPQQGFDTIICIDAAYHTHLNSFLLSTASVLNSKGRLGFHYLILSDGFLNLNAWQKLRYTALLKAADVNLKHLPTYQSLQEQLEQLEFKNIQIENISTQVFDGFAHYAQHCTAEAEQGLDLFKISMTGKLCRTLFNEGVVQYVQVSAQKAV